MKITTKLLEQSEDKLLADKIKFQMEKIVELENKVLPLERQKGCGHPKCGICYPQFMDHADEALASIKSQDSERPLRASGDFLSVQNSEKPDTYEPVKDEVEEFFKNIPVPSQMLPLPPHIFLSWSDAIIAKCKREMRSGI